MEAWCWGYNQQHMPQSQKARRWYAELDLKPWCTDEQLHQAYRQAAKKFHPDRHGGSEKAGQRFQTITSSYNELLDHRKIWGAAKKPDEDPVSGRRTNTSSSSGAGAGNARRAGSAFYTDGAAGDHGGHGSTWPRPITDEFNYNGPKAHLKALYENQDPNYVFSSRGFRAPKFAGRVDPFGTLNRATPQHYSATEGRVRTILCGAFLVCAGLLAWTASTSRMPWQQSTLNSRWGAGRADGQPMEHGRHNAVARSSATVGAAVSRRACAEDEEQARRLKLEGDAAKSRGDFTAANAAYTKAARLVS